MKYAEQVIVNASERGT